jgi:hypothetical protein
MDPSTISPPAGSYGLLLAVLVLWLFAIRSRTRNQGD